MFGVFENEYVRVCTAHCTQSNLVARDKTLTSRTHQATQHGGCGSEARRWRRGLVTKMRSQRAQIAQLATASISSAAGGRFSAVGLHFDETRGAPGT